MQTQPVSTHADAADASLTPRQRLLIAIFGRATGFFSPRVVSEALGVSLTTQWRQRQRGEFPNPIQLSPGRKAYTPDQLGTYLESCALERELPDPEDLRPTARRQPSRPPRTKRQAKRRA